MKALKIFFLLLFFLFSDIPIVEMGRSFHASGEEEVIELARLGPRVGMRSRGRRGGQWRGRPNRNVRKSVGRKVFSSPRSLPRRQKRELVSQRLRRERVLLSRQLTRRPRAVGLASKRAVRAGREAISAQSALIRDLRLEQKELRSQFISTARHRNRSLRR